MATQMVEYASDRTFASSQRQLPERLLLRPSEAAELTGVSRTIAYQMIASGEWPKVTIGNGSIRVPLEGLREWIARNTVAARD